jgi:hypothetical protein
MMKNDDEMMEMSISEDDLFEALCITGIQRLKSRGWSAVEVSDIRREMVESICGEMVPTVTAVARAVSAAAGQDGFGEKAASLITSSIVAVRAVEIADKFHDARRRSPCGVQFSAN